jgi:hypothetical protein
MKQQTISQLKNYLYNDRDFKNVFDKQFPQTFVLEYGNAIDEFIDSMVYESIIDFYLIDKRYIDIAWFQTNNELINMDSLYMDWKLYVQDYQR